MEFTRHRHRSHKPRLLRTIRRIIRRQMKKMGNKKTHHYPKWRTRRMRGGAPDDEFGSGAQPEPTASAPPAAPVEDSSSAGSSSLPSASSELGESDATASTPPSQELSSDSTSSVDLFGSTNTPPPPPSPPQVSQETDSQPAGDASPDSAPASESFDFGSNSEVNPPDNPSEAESDTLPAAGDDYGAGTAADMGEQTPSPLPPPPPPPQEMGEEESPSPQDMGEEESLSPQDMGQEEGGQESQNYDPGSLSPFQSSFSGEGMDDQAYSPTSDPSQFPSSSPSSPSPPSSSPPPAPLPPLPDTPAVTNTTLSPQSPYFYATSLIQMEGNTDTNLTSAGIINFTVFMPIDGGRRFLSNVSNLFGKEGYETDLYHQLRLQIWSRMNEIARQNNIDKVCNFTCDIQTSNFQMLVANVLATGYKRM